MRVVTRGGGGGPQRSQSWSFSEGEARSFSCSRRVGTIIRRKNAESTRAGIRRGMRRRPMEEPMTESAWPEERLRGEGVDMPERMRRAISGVRIGRREARESEEEERRARAGARASSIRE